MKALSAEQSIMEGESSLKDLFNFIEDHAEEMKAYEAEKAIFSALMAIGRSGLKLYFSKKGTGDRGSVLKMDSGDLKRVPGLYGRDYFSVFGKVKAPRTCYRADGENGVFPLDADADLPERCYSYLLQDWMDLMSIRDSYKESELTLEKLLGLKVSVSRFETVNRESSVDYDRFYEEKPVAAAESEGEIQVMCFDGKGVPMIKKEAAKLTARLGKGEKRLKKKEAMVGVGYTVDRKVRSAEDVAEHLIFPEKTAQKREVQKKKGETCEESPKAKNIRRMASLEKPKESVIREIAEDARKRNKDGKRPMVVLMDGALGLWALIIKVLAGMDFVGILDIIHVTEYLWKAGNALFGEKTEVGKKWVYRQLLSILKGNVGRVIGGMKQTLKKRKLKDYQQEVLKTAIKYFENHRQWMKYDEYLEAGYPIGTGVVESTCGRTVKDRMEGNGRRWSVTGAESVLLLRSLYTSGDWDAYRLAHMRFERERLYGGVMKDLNVSDDYFESEQMKKAA